MHPNEFMTGFQLERLLPVLAMIAPIGCEANDPLEIDTAQFTENLCDEELQVLDAIEPIEPVDYLALVEGTSPSDDDQDDRPPVRFSSAEPWTLDESGERCPSEWNEETCDARYGDLIAGSDFELSGQVFLYRALVVRQANDLRVVRSQAELENLIGGIDSPADAALLESLRFTGLVCTEDDDAGADPRGFLLHTIVGGGCGEGDDIEQQVVLVNDKGGRSILEERLIERADPGCAVGRRPAGLWKLQRSPCTGSSSPRARASAVGAFFASMAHLEAASVTAFEQLVRDLRCHSAPRGLIARTERARRDEIRHARVTASLARRYGGRPVRPTIRRTAPRSLLELASDNATEGCVRETYGALVAHVQTRQARSPVVRRALMGIAHDETQHAGLSWDLAAWTRSRLSPTEQRRVAAETRNAIDQLQHELRQEYPHEVHTIAGMPTPDHAHALYTRLRHHLRSSMVSSSSRGLLT